MGCIPTKLRSSRSFDSIASIPSASKSPDPSAAITAEEAARRLTHHLLPLDLDSLELKQAISNSKELRTLADSYLNIAILDVLKVLSHVDACIEKAYVKLRMILEAISTFQEELETARDGPRKKRDEKMKKIYRKTISKLKEFKLADDPLEEIECEELVSLQSRLKDTVTQLRKRKRHLEGRLSSGKSWRKAWDVIFTGAFVAMLVVSVALAAVGMVPAAVTGVAATATAMKAAETWLKSRWDEGEREVAEEQEVVQTMRVAVAEAEGHELVNVLAVMEKLSFDIKEVRYVVDFSLGKGGDEGMGALRLGIEEMEKKIGEVEVGLTQLKQQVAVCVDGLKKGSKEFLKGVVE